MLCDTLWSDRHRLITKSISFITLKDHGDNFENKPTCTLINPLKQEIGKISKQILYNIITTLQWINTSSDL